MVRGTPFGGSHRLARDRRLPPTTRALSACAQLGGSVPRPVAPGRLTVDEEAVPPLEAEQRPDEKAVVVPSGHVLVQDTPHRARAEVAARDRPRIQQQAANLLHRRAAVPRLVGWAETLLRLLGDLLRQQPAHGLSEDSLAAFARVLHLRRDAARNVD